jgi:hypothetical protein
MAVNRPSDDLEPLVLALLDDMHASGLPLLDQATALSRALVVWSINLDPVRRDQFLGTFLELVQRNRGIAETWLRDNGEEEATLQ